ncbi:hypothetical protein HDV04_006327 [Boothiomyces sp. JEL0838]|nr:hypothetical protein HDV04_006322 [Boothiomyces sp. JEL0838]KAJ3309192.1 hypothetical protein HDV04_006327 [Boothiomyces sp. JEL0838]
METQEGIAILKIEPQTPEKVKKARAKSKTPKKKTPTKKASEPNAKKGPPQGGAFIKHVLKKGGKNGGPLLIEDLNESIDTAEYIKYLDSKKDEKLDAINMLAESNKNDYEVFLKKKKQYEELNQLKIAELKQVIQELEDKLNSKEEEFFDLSDTMAKRAKHEADVTKIRKEIREAEDFHQEKILEMEKQLLDTRMKLQKESDEKIKQMEAAAEEKAAKYLADHTSALQKENRTLEKELALLSLTTQRLLARKDQLEKENLELEREKQLRLDLISIRMKRIKDAQIYEEQRTLQRHLRMDKKRRQVMDKIIAQKGLQKMESGVELVGDSFLDGWEDVSDDD